MAAVRSTGSRSAAGRTLSLGLGLVLGLWLGGGGYILQSQGGEHPQSRTLSPGGGGGGYILQLPGSEHRRVARCR